MSAFMLMFMLVMIRSRNCEVNHQQDRKNQGLNYPHQNLQEKKRYRDHVSEKRRHGREENLARKHISKETERKRSHFGKFANNFYQAHKERDRGYDYHRRLMPDLLENPPECLQINIFVKSFPDADGEDAEDVGAYYRRHSERNCGIKICRAAPEKRDECEPMISALNEPEAAERNDAEPVVYEDKEKGGNRYGKNPHRNIPIIGDLVAQI